MEKVGGKEICVIGAGASGLPAIKSCLEEGLQPTCYERTASIGGLWNYRPEKKNLATVMRSTIVNTSKEMMAYSDFPPPPHFPNFMHNTLVNQYMHHYVEHFHLNKYIHFNTAVDKVEKSEKEKGKWAVTISTGEQKLFDGVILCTGHHAIPNVPTLPGLDEFEGEVMHSQKYRDWHGMEGKKVLVVGIGNSALDCAVELSRIASKVYMSTRRGSWIWHRVAEGGMPYDVLYLTRFYSHLMNNVVPWTVSNDYMEHKVHRRMDHEIYGLRPRHRFFQQHPAVNDALPNLLASGQLTIRSNVSKFEKKGVRFEDDSFAEVDVVIFCTGYKISFPYLHPQGLIPVTDNQVALYKYVFPPSEGGLAVVGLIQPIGSIAPISEMQSRYIARVFAGNAQLPSEMDMWEDIKEKRAKMAKRYFDSPKHTVQVDYVDYMDQMGELLGVRPSLWQYLLSGDWRFSLRLYFSANYPYVYRLQGPHSWSEAKQAILEAPLRIKQPLKQRQCRVRRYKRRGTFDEYLRYMLIKWPTVSLVFLLCCGLWAFCVGPAAIPFSQYFLMVFIFCGALLFIFQFFNLQYDMSVII